MRRFVSWIWDQLDPLMALLLGAVCSILGLAGIASGPILSAAILGTLTLIAFSIMRERTAREKIQGKIDGVQGKMDGLIDKIEKPIADAFFSHSKDEEPLIKDAEHLLLLVQETGSLITEQKREQIVSFLNRGGEVRVVVASPTEQTARMMAFRNANLEHDDLLKRSQLFHAQLVNILTQIKGREERIQLRYIPYPIGMTCVIADPESTIKSRRRAIVRYADFMIPYGEKLDFAMSGDTSPETFAHYYEQAQKLFHNAYKVVLLTGEPRSGKTTIMRSLIANIDAYYIYYVISRAVWTGDERQGFEVMTSANPNPTKFAERQADGSYSVDSAVWDNIAVELEAAMKDRKIIVLDEIGPMQVKSSKFSNFVDSVLNSKHTTLFATVALNDDSPVIRRVKTHHRSTILKLLSKDNEGVILRTLEDELNSSITTTKRISRP